MRSIKQIQRDAAERRGKAAPPSPRESVTNYLRLSIRQIQEQGDAWVKEHRCESLDPRVVGMGPAMDDSSYSSGPYLDRGIRCHGCGATWNASNRIGTR